MSPIARFRLDAAPSSTAIVSPTGGNVGIGFAIPASTAESVIDDLKTHGQVMRGWLGVQIQGVTPDIAESLDLTETEGAIVARVQPESPAAAAGLQADDVIVAVDGRKVSGLADFYRKLWALGDAGVTVPLTVLTRDGMTEIPVGSGDRYDYLRLEPSL